MEKPRGTKDYFGKEMALRVYVENVVYTLATLYNFEPIDTPIFEHAEVFRKPLGEGSDIVTKEMFTFTDKGGRELTLRPEGTAPVLRAVVEHKLYLQNPLKLFYFGPMFRYENPQRGRHRQFHQFGVELITEPSLASDLEVILLAASILTNLKVKYVLRVNSLGDEATRAHYMETLRSYFTAHKDVLSPASQRRVETNPLRILDDKVDRELSIVKNAPSIDRFYSQVVADRLRSVVEALQGREIPVIVDHALVRGLDYYTGLTFEFQSVSAEAGAQSTLIGGGRYEHLLHSFGGPARSGIGFAVGIERLINEVAPLVDPAEIAPRPDIYVMNIASERTLEVLEIVTFLRDEGFVTEWNMQPLKIQKALAKADASNAHVQIIVGPQELDQEVLSVRLHGKQHQVALTQLVPFIAQHLEGEHENH